MKINFDTLADLASEVGGDTKVHYSGRFMYGATCVGIVLDESDLLALGVAIGEVEDENLRDYLVNRYSTDSLGYQTNVYWQGLTCEDAPEDEE